MNDTTAYTEVKIGATITIGTCLMNHILHEFQSYYPQAEVRVSINTPDYLGPSWPGMNLISRWSKVSPPART